MSDLLSERNIPIVLITGITGGIGAELLPRILEKYRAHNVVGLIRGTSEESVADRLDEILVFSDITLDNRCRVSALRAELEEPDFGLPNSTWRDLANRTTAVFHLAANVNFTSSLEESRLANVTCTERVIEFCFACLAMNTAEFRFHYVSTAYVSGKRQGLLRETELNVGQEYWNAYEQSKSEAEQLVSKIQGKIPTTIYRPSQVIGDSLTGRVRKYFGLYEFLKIAHRGKISVLPANAMARQDMVPVDYVCDGLVFLSQHREAVGKTYHLAAGLEQSIPLGEAIRLIHREYYSEQRSSKKVLLPELISPEELDRAQPEAQKNSSRIDLLQMIMGAYRPYLSHERDFDICETSALLRNAGIPFPSISEVLLKTVNYAIHRKFGLWK